MKTNKNDKNDAEAINEAAVALANKNARVIWALLTKGEDFDAEHLIQC